MRFTSTYLFICSSLIPLAFTKPTSPSHARKQNDASGGEDESMGNGSISSTMIASTATSPEFHSASSPATPLPRPTSIFSPYFDPSTASEIESPAAQTLISTLELRPNAEGGYFRETDRDALRIPNPFATQNPFSYDASGSGQLELDSRSLSTTIYYLLTEAQPRGAFHRIKARNIHTWHGGRGRYVIIHADEVSNPLCNSPVPGYGCEGLPESEKWIWKARIETFIVGGNLTAGERQQWIVDGGKYKASFLLPDGDGGADSEGLLISETVVPGFEYVDHDYLEEERMRELVTEAQFEELKWLLRNVTTDEWS